MTGTSIDAFDDSIKIFLRESLKIRSLRVIISQETISVFIESPFPGTVGTGAVHRDLEHACDSFMGGNLAAIVMRHRPAEFQREGTECPSCRTAEG